jgi:hypothetical protein
MKSKLAKQLPAGARSQGQSPFGVQDLYLGGRKYL